MRAKIRWTAALAALLCLALAGAAGSRDVRGPAPGVPASSWSVVASMPQTLHGAAGVSNGTYAYAAGGVNAGGTTLDTFYRYNPVNERWDTYPPPMPAALEMASAVYYPTTNSIYVFGGKNGSVFSNATWVLDLTANTWTPVANMPAPRASMAAGYNSANGRIYLVGGSTPPARRQRHGSTSPARTRSPPTACRSRTRWPVPPPESSPAISTWQAGTTHPRVLSTTWDYSIGADTWTARSDLPTPTDAPGSAVASGKLWVFGGETPSTPSATTVAYDPAANSWASGPSLNVARSGSGRRCDREHARGRRRGHGLDVDGSDRGAGCGIRLLRPSRDHVQRELRRRDPARAAAGWTATNAPGPAAAVDDLELGHAHAAPSTLLRTRPSSTIPRSSATSGSTRRASRSRRLPPSSPSATTTTPRPRSTAACWRSASAAAPSRTSAPRAERLVVGTYSGTLQTGLGNPLSGRLGLDRQLEQRLHHVGRDPAALRRRTERRAALADGQRPEHRGARAGASTRSRSASASAHHRLRLLRRRLRHHRRRPHHRLRPRRPLRRLHHRSARWDRLR